MTSNYEFIESGDKSLKLDYSINFPCKVSFIDLNGLMRKTFNQHEMNGITKLNNGYLTVLNEKIERQFIDKYVEDISYYAEYCNEKGAKFLFISPAYTVSKHDSELPKGDLDYTNDTLDYLLDSLEKKGVSVIDLREKMHDDGINQYDYYYRTDHHWNTLGAFYGYQSIVEWITENTGCDVDEKLTNIEDYYIDTYANWHLGTRGQRTGRYYAGMDDYQLIHPKFSIELTRTSDGKKGTFDEIAINWDILSNYDATNRYTYDRAFSTDDWKYDDAKSDLKVYMISDSYATAVNPYMKLTYTNYFYENDLESTSYSKKTFDNISPDVVIMMIYPGQYSENNPNMFEVT